MQQHNNLRQKGKAFSDKLENENATSKIKIWSAQKEHQN